MDKEEFFKDVREDLPGPLNGVLVVEATTTWAGPMTGCILADLGARVIKLEHPSGEVARNIPPMVPESQLSVFNETVNRNKESLSVDLRSEKGKEVVVKLVEKADLFIENFRPGTLNDWGLGFSSLRQYKSDLVYVSVSGFGQFGPLSERVGYDPLAQNYTGWAALNGEPMGGPVKAPTFLADDLGGLHGALAAMAALRHRDQSGEGQHVDVSLVDSIMFQSNGLASLGAMGLPTPRMGNQFSIAAPVNNYVCSDGTVFAGVLLDSHWQQLAKEIGQEQLQGLSGAQRLEQRESLDALLAAYCLTRKVEDIVTRFAELGLPATRVNTPAEVAQEPHIHARDMLISTQLSDGTIMPIVGPAAKFSRTPTTIRHPAPRLGQHNDRILSDLGYSDAERAELRDKGAVG
ncbi:MAG: CoA transferase [Gammaproteobacteria bacterium]|jgi:formyl-CoA transferase|nr:CoA transferase [Gammaproteobacteria bacterium]MBT5203525.1 CoA transferase [Gammaproteobacteria bacterium]MBT5603791.1 CoA transferase [Gammaproteobacteria bacterium]MBT6244391.1 CoA transferase [Gammaproteobacteria bacterium]